MDIVCYHNMCSILPVVFLIRCLMGRSAACYWQPSQRTGVNFIPQDERREIQRTPCFPIISKNDSGKREFLEQAWTFTLSRAWINSELFISNQMEKAHPAGTLTSDIQDDYRLHRENISLCQICISTCIFKKTLKLVYFICYFICNVFQR